MDQATPEDVFDLIDADKSGQIDGREGFEALYCAVMAEMLTEEEARDAFKYLAKAAGDDNLLSKDEAKAAMGAMDSEESLAE